jgi:hypothetical protein
MCDKKCENCSYHYVCKELWEVYIDSIVEMCMCCKFDEENENAMDEDCTVTDCPLNSNGPRPTAMDLKEEIRLYCLNCKNGCERRAAKCDFTDCPLYPVRLGQIHFLDNPV